MHLKLPLLRRLASDNRAVAAVEFALIMPLLVTLYFGTVEAASVYTVDRRVSTVANTIADLVSREKDTVSKANALDKYFEAAKAIMRPDAVTGLTQRVSFLTVSSTGVATVAWSYAKGTTARETGKVFPLDAGAKVNQLARTKGFLVVSEVTYSYKPLFGLVLSNNINLVHTEYYLPRYEESITLVN